MRTKFNLSIASITKVSLLGYVIYLSADAVYISWGINSIVKQAIFVNISDRKKQSGSLDGGVGGEYNGVRLVDMFEIFVKQDDFFLFSGAFWHGE